MVPVPEAPKSVAPFRKRLERAAFGLNGAIFLIGAWDGLDAGGPPWAIGVNLALGAVQIVALLRSRKASLPERLPYSLAAAGLFASMVLVLHHKTGLPYAYAFAGVINVVLAIWGPERFRRLVRGRWV